MKKLKKTDFNMVEMAPEILPEPFPNLIKTFKSRDFLCQVYLEKKGVHRLSINKVKRTPGSKDWVDGITWDELQKIKNACGYDNMDAVEFYPREIDVVNVANIRHLWVLPFRHALCWRNPDGANQ